MPDESQLSNMDPRIQRALTHPGRMEILGYLMKKGGGRGATKGELVVALGTGIRIVEYHLRVLRDAGLITLLGDEQDSGDAERSYVAAPSR